MAVTTIERKRRVELHPRSWGFGLGLPAPQTDRHGMAERWESRALSLIGATCRGSSFDHCTERGWWGRRLVRRLPCRG